jgi:hypothetical protein
MNTAETTAGLPPDIQADTDALIQHLTSGKPLDPAVARRIRERGDRIREDILQKHGLQDIGVPAVRELRGELPNP